MRRLAGRVNRKGSLIAQVLRRWLTPCRANRRTRRYPGSTPIVTEFAEQPVEIGYRPEGAAALPSPSSHPSPIHPCRMLLVIATFYVVPYP